MTSTSTPLRAYICLVVQYGGQFDNKAVLPGDSFGSRSTQVSFGLTLSGDPGCNLYVMQRVKRWLVDPKVVLLGVALGFVIGLTARPVGRVLYPAGSIYVSFLSMCLMPILITSIIGGIAGLLRDVATQALFGRIAANYVFGLGIPCLAGISTAKIFEPGSHLGDQAKRSIGRLILDAPFDQNGDAGLVSFLASIVPPNLFEALSKNQVMSIVFVSVCAGLALGVLRSNASHQILLVIEAIHEIFMQLFGWAILLLAPGLTCLVSGIVAEVDPSTLLALCRFIFIFYIGGILLLGFYFLVFWLAVGGPLRTTLRRLSNVNIVAFMTNNPILALPMALETLEKSFGIHRRVPELVVPFGIFANQHGAVYLMSFLTMFLAQIYVIEIDIQTYVIIAVGSIVAGATAVGGGAILIPTVAPLLAAIGIPTPVALVVLATTDNIIGPLRTALTMQANLTVTALTARPNRSGPYLPHPQDEVWTSEAT